MRQDKTKVCYCRRSFITTEHGHTAFATTVKSVSLVIIWGVSNFQHLRVLRRPGSSNSAQVAALKPRPLSLPFEHYFDVSASCRCRRRCRLALASYSTLADEEQKEEQDASGRGSKVLLKSAVTACYIAVAAISGSMAPREWECSLDTVRIFFFQIRRVCCPSGKEAT